MLHQIDASLLTDLTEPTMPTEGRQETLLIVLVAVMMLAGGTLVMYCVGAAGTTTKRLKAAGAMVLALGVGVFLSLHASAAMANDRQADYAAAMRTYEDSVAERDREASRAEKAVLTAVKEQYRVREARPADTDQWGWKTARAALTDSNTDSPTIEVLTEDDQREHVQVEYDNTSGQVTLIADGTQSKEANLDVASLRREKNHD